MTAIDITVATNAGIWHVDCRTSDLTPLEKAALDAFLALASNSHPLETPKPKAKPRAPRKRPVVVEDRGDWLRRKETG